MTPHGTDRTDAQIHDAVLQALHWETRVDETEVETQVERGDVTLTGVVGTYAAKLIAEDATHRVVGVLEVANDLQVAVPNSATRADIEIAFAARRALEWDALMQYEGLNTQECEESHDHDKRQRQDFV